MTEKNVLYPSGVYRLIPLTKGRFAKVNPEDHEYLSQWKWSFCNGYAIRCLRIAEGHGYAYMHRVVNNTPDGLDTDHINGDKLDNRRANLRSATPSENLRNKSMQSNNTSGFRGVYWNRRRHKWMASITNYGKQIHLGYFLDPLKAAEAYNVAALAMHGEFARPNDLEKQA